ncbi:MAG: hypothetical protein SOR93_09650 [Clostridiales Family XIII bacterium]|nr:hypothetical protein [Clostridia bacterium]MDY3011498.1 hypothetical protein [Clostridiales Family XIII bacterium]
MLKAEMVKDMKEAFGRPYATASQIGRHFGRSDNWAKMIVKGLPKIPAEEKGDRYSVHDVAERVLEQVRA